MLRAQAHEAPGRSRPRPERLPGSRRGSIRRRSSAFTAQGGIWRERAIIRQGDRRLRPRGDGRPERRGRHTSLRAEAFAAKGDRKRAMTDIGRALKLAWTDKSLKVRGELRLDDGDSQRRAA